MKMTATISKRKQLLVWITAFAVAAAFVVSMLFWALHVSHQQQRDRIVARYILCVELEKVRSAQRAEVAEAIADAEEFLRTGRTVPGISNDDIQRTIDRRKRLLAALHPVYGGCAEFARNPNHEDIVIPPGKED